MPKAKEKKLKRQAEEKGLSGKRKDAYVYGTLRKMGWKPKREKSDHPAWGTEIVVSSKVVSAGPGVKLV